MTDAPFTDPWSEAHRKGLVGLREWLRREGDTVYWQADIDAALAEIDRLRTALVAARQFLSPEIDRGPAVNGWYNTVTLVNEALGEETP